MTAARTLRGFLLPLLLAAVCLPGLAAEESDTRPAEGRQAESRGWMDLGRDLHRDLSDRGSMTGGFFGLNDALEPHGVELALSLTQILQKNLRGGLDSDRCTGGYAGSYDLQVEFDLERLLKLPGATVYAYAEGSWSDGIDPFAVGSATGNVNGDAGGNQAIQLSELWYEQQLLDGRLRFRVGKQDLTGGFEHADCPVAFDSSLYANDETSQFLNAALVNNPTIPFPDYALGAAVLVAPVDWWYVSAAAADAHADGRETGFGTAFHGEAHYFSIYETGVLPRLPSSRGELIGAYRAGLWYDPRPKDRHDGSGTENHDVGFYFTADQQLFRESAEADDPQGLGAFLRFGWADPAVSDVQCFYSAGASYRGLIPARDADVLAVGFASGRLVEAAGYTQEHETVLETYYQAELMPWLHVAPSLQYVWNPGGGEADNACVLGLRCQMQF
jgi:porin